MDYNINDFVERLRIRMYYRFPVEKNIVNLKKHKNRIKHIRDVAFMDNKVEYISDDIRVFDIGNEYAEKEYPYYHILEDAPVIHKRYEGTIKSKGSQAQIQDLSLRDYNKVNFNGKTFSKEYARNVRGKRKSVIDRSTRYVDGKKINLESKTYANVHYHYIENMLNAINPIIADEFGLKYARTSLSGLQTDYILGETETSYYDSEYIDLAYALGNM